MRFRFVGLLDVAVVVVVLIAILMPAREMYASDAHKGTPEKKFALALAEARSLAHLDDAVSSVELSHALSDAKFHDWAVEEAVRGTERAKGTPQRWRVLFAAAEAYVDQYDAAKGLDYSERALSACDSAGEPACPSWEQLRMSLYAQQLDAGVKSGIDPRKDPIRFRAAGERGLRGVRIRGHEAELQPGAPTPGGGGGKGSAGSAATPGSAGSSAP